MSCRREAAWWRLGLVLGLVAVGCAGPPRRTSPPGDSRLPVPNLSAATAPEAPARLGPVPVSPLPVQRAALEELPTTAKPAITQAAAAQPPATPPAADPQARLGELYRLAAERFATIDSYIARVRRREQVNGKDRPEELLLFKFRKEPWSVYFKFLGPEGKGREVVFVKGQYGNQIHTLLAAGDMPLAPAGKRMALAPDSLFVRAASRHVITEAGIGEIIQRFGRLLDAIEKGDTHYGTVRYVGAVKRPEYEAPLEAAEVTLPSGLDPALPRGGKRLVMFDPASRLLVLVITLDDTGHEVEYYCYDRLEFPVQLDADDFNPDKLWPAK